MTDAHQTIKYYPLLRFIPLKEPGFIPMKEPGFFPMKEPNGLIPKRRAKNAANMRQEHIRFIEKTFILGIDGVE